MKKSDTLTAFSMITAALMGLCIVMNAVSLITYFRGGSVDGTLVMCVCADSVVALFGSVYLLSGGTKYPGGVIMKVFFILCLISTLLKFALGETRGLILPCAMYAAASVGYGVLAFFRDLGEKRSKLAASGALAAMLILYIRKCITAPGLGLDGWGQLSGLIISVSVLVLIFVKYEDKKLRGSK